MPALTIPARRVIGCDVGKAPIGVFDSASGRLASLANEPKALHVFAQTLAPDSLEAKLWVDYTRITLAGRNERLTIDLDLHYSFDGEAVSLPGLVIAELKTAGRPQTSPFAQLMRQRLVRPHSFSKYCIGASLLYPWLKHNRFSRTLRQIDPYQERIH